VFFPGCAQPALVLLRQMSGGKPGQPWERTFQSWEAQGSQPAASMFLDPWEFPKC